MSEQVTLEDIRQAFLAYQKANDAQLEKLKAGIVTAATSDKVEALNKEITELQARMDEQAKEVSRLQIGGGTSGKVNREELRQHAQSFFAGIRKVEDPEDVSDQDVEAYAAYCKAFPKWIAKGEKALNDPQIRAAMQVGSDPDGGYWVPTQRMSEIIMREHETSEVRPLADVIGPISGDSVEWMNDVNLASTGGFVGETATRSETNTPKVGTQSIYVREQYAEPRCTQKFLDMSGIDAEGWLARKTAQILTITENNRFVVGAGVVNPRGFLDYSSAAVTTDDASRAWGVLQYVPTGQASGFPTVSGVPGAADADSLITIVSKLKPIYRAGAVWAMSRSTEAAIRKLKDADGRYLVGAGVEGNFTGFQLGGYPIRTMEDMPVIGSNSFSVAFGNFKQGFQIVDGRGLRVIRDNITLKGWVKFYTTKWTGSDVVNFDALKLLKFGTS